MGQGETKNDEELAKSMGSLAETYENGAFGSAHCARSSTEGVTELPTSGGSGLSLSTELEYFQGALHAPVKPAAAIVGGAQVSTKMAVIETMLNKLDKLVIGGGMVFTFLKARGLTVGKSMVDDECVELAKKLEEEAQ